MATENPTDWAHSAPESPADSDAQVESAVLAFVLAEHPAQIALSELSLAINGESVDFAAGDDVARAVDHLVRAGLLHRVGPLVLPTRAARYFDALEAN